MRFTYLFFSLLLCLSSYAQPNPINRRAMAIAGLATPAITADLTDVAYRWVAYDTATNAAISGNWNDRIQNLALHNGNSATRPTNSNGTNIWIDSSHWLTNLPPATGSNMAFGFILKMIDPTGANGTHPDLLSEGNESVCTASSLGLGFDSSTSYKFRAPPACDTVNFLDNKFGSLTNVYCDMVWCQSISNAGGINQHRICWTNGALSLANSANAGTAFFGSAAGSPNAPVFLGHNGFRNSGPSFWLAEYWIWTNGPPAATNGTILNPTRLANFHKYATNTYGGTP